jgi:NAD(P) transhydrogenase
VSIKSKTSNPSKPYRYDAIVIGSGPGGEGASMQLTKGGKKVAVIEREGRIGGGCTHWGTIPSKALRHAVTRLIELRQNPLFDEESYTGHNGFSSMLKHAESVINKQVRLRSGFYKRNSVDIYQGNASFIDQHTLQIKKTDGSFDIIEADNIVLAVGSRPYNPPNVDFSHPRVHDSDTILSLDFEPEKIIIYGAGVIGCEYASIFRGLGVRTDLINTRDRLLSFLDVETSDALSYHFWDSDIQIKHNETYDRIEATDDRVIVHMESGKVMQADVLLFANGRTGNTKGLNLEAIGLASDSRGQLQVNSRYQTDIDNIYAVGDVIGYPSLASAAYDQGRLTGEAILTGEDVRNLIDHIPTGIYTIPEISSVGKTEIELTAEKVPYEVGRAQFQHLARAQISDQKVGNLKILFHRESKAILGIHCFGERASEIIHIGQAIMEQEGPGNTIEYFVNTTFNYPTMAEAYRVAALNGLNRLF